MEKKPDKHQNAHRASWPDKCSPCLDERGITK